MVSDFVLDASVAAARCFADETTPKSNALRESVAERRALVPRLWHAETTNLLLMAERRQRIKPERCEELLELIASLPIETLDESDRMRGPVLRMARAHRLTDAVYLDLALDRGLPLATRDVALQRAARAEGVSLIETYQRMAASARAAGGAVPRGTSGASTFQSDYSGGRRCRLGGCAPL